MIKQIDISSLDREVLASISLDPVMLADDFCDYSKVIVRKPWGYEYLLFGNEEVAVWVLYIKPGAQTSMHCHPSKKTSLIVLQGKALCSTLNGDIERQAGEGLLLEKKVFHQTKAVSEQGVFVMEIETPVNKRDLIRLKDLYGREQQAYESSDKHSKNTQNYNYLSLNGPEVQYNLKKRFGECTITLKRLGNSEALTQILELDPQDVLSILSGEIVDRDGKKIVEVGDTISIQDLKSFNDLKIGRSSEVLIVKKIDSIIKVSDFIVKFLKSQNANTVFLVPGDANVHLLDSIGRDEQLSYVAHKLEREACMAAEGYSKATSNFGFLVISSGASGADCLRGVSQSWIDSTPLFVISGQARSDQDSDGKVRQLGNKALNIVDLVKPITKYAVKVVDPTLIRFYLEEALTVAKDGRPGPVWLDIPIDIQGMTIDEKDLKPFTPKKSTPESSRANSKVAEVFSLLNSAKRPVVLAGNGIRISSSVEKFLQLVDKLKIPVLTSRRGADIIEEQHPLFFGRPGTFGQRRANFIIQNADLVLSIGSRLSIPLIGRNTKAFARSAKKIVVDIDTFELQKDTVEIDLALKMDVGSFITQMLEDCDSAYQGRFAEWIERCERWCAEFPPLNEGYKHKQQINPYIFINTLAKCMQEKSCIVVDGGAVMHMTMQIFEFKKGQRLISSTGLELPGFGLSGAIGASVGNGMDRVVCILEDRGFETSVQELQTIVDNKLPITVFVLKSKGHATVRKIQKDFFGGRFVGTDNEILFGSPDFLQIGKAYSICTSSISSSLDLPAKISAALAANGPHLCQIEVDSDQELLPRMGFVVKDDGKWIPKPLEDMYPFLERKTLRENMLIDILAED